jgi:cob(I)alamin adenosyltransferase
MIHLYTGDGKGKTTASLGLAFRALGHGRRVYMIQFMKGSCVYGETIMAESLKDFTLVQFGRKEFVDRTNPSPEDYEEARKALTHARRVLAEGLYDLIILDELNVALDYGLIELSEVMNILDNAPSSSEIVITGRNAVPELIEKAHLVTEMKEIKHPYRIGVSARKGIEF